LGDKGPDYEHVEVTTFRGEGGYSDGRRPDHVFYIDDLAEDLRRRDFTINAIAYDPIRDQLFDPYKGQEDLRRRLIRAVGDAQARFSEDGLRTMRAVRFAAQLGYRIDEATLAAIPGALATLRKVSGERVRDELLKLLRATDAAQGLALMRVSGLLGEVLPELHAAVAPGGEAAFARLFRIVERMAPDSMLRLLALLSPLRPATAPDRLLDRLKLSAKERDRLDMFLRSAEVPDGPSFTPAQVRRFLAATPAALVADREAVLRAELLADGRQAEVAASSGPLELYRRAAEERVRGPALSAGQLALGGGEVMEILGIGKGPMVGVILRRLLDRVLEEPALNTKDRLTALLPQIHEEAQSQAPQSPQSTKIASVT
jgi:tRNA nucleotidyltransferase (CCA-adding enzyme)